MFEVIFPKILYLKINNVVYNRNLNVCFSDKKCKHKISEI